MSLRSSIERIADRAAYFDWLGGPGFHHVSTIECYIIWRAPTFICQLRDALGPSFCSEGGRVGEAWKMADYSDAKGLSSVWLGIAAPILLVPTSQQVFMYLTFQGTLITGSAIWH